jgi:hypothetical protein
MVTNPNRSNSRSAKGFQNSPSQQQAKEENGIQKKLVTLPGIVWDELKGRGYHIPTGDFSSKFFARKLLHFSFVKDITMEAKKLLFIYLCREMFTFDTTICKGFADVTYNEKDRNLFLNIADKIEELGFEIEIQNEHQPEEVEEFAEQAA